MENMNEAKCYVLIFDSYSDGRCASVYWNEQDAYRTMVEDRNIEIINLENSNYNFRVVENDTSVELYVPDTDIFFEWHIEEAAIR